MTIMNTLKKKPTAMDKTVDAVFTNWKTTLPAVLAAAATLVVTTPGHFGANEMVVNVAGFIMAGGLAAFGVAAKAHDKSGTPDSQP